jgi:integrase
MSGLVTKIGSWFSRGITVRELIAAYTEFAWQYYRKDDVPTAEALCIVAVMRRLEALYGDKRCDDFGPLALQTVVARMVDDDLTRKTINNNLSRIKRMFRWAVSRELVSSSVVNALGCVDGLREGRSNARETEPVGVVPDDVVAATLPHLSSVVRSMVEFQRLTGCRPGEVCYLRPCDVDRSGEVWVYFPGSHKTQHRGRDRRIFIGPKAQAILRPFLLRAADSFCFSPQDVTSRRAGRRPPGARYTTNSYRYAVQRKCRQRGIQLWGPNQLRHAAATEIRKLFGVEAAQVVLGHAEADVTQIYAQRDYDLAARVAKQVG